MCRSSSFYSDFGTKVNRTSDTIFAYILSFQEGLGGVDTNKNRCGPRVQLARGLRDWTQAQLAAELQLLGLDIGRSAIGKIEVGIRCVTDVELTFLAEVFDVTSDWLLALDDADATGRAPS